MTSHHCETCGGFVYGEMQVNDVLCRCRLFVSRPPKQDRVHDDVLWQMGAEYRFFMAQPQPLTPSQLRAEVEAKDPTTPWVLTDADRDFLRVQRIDPEI